MAKRRCSVCGAAFNAPPSDKTVTCSKACSSIHRSRKHLGVGNTWSDEARERKRAAGRPATLTLGTPAARISPRSGPYETNINAKTWIVISPTGEEYTVRNLRLWCDSNANLFAPHEPRRAIGGLRQVAAWLAGKRRRQVSQWRGWTLKDLPRSDGTA